VAAYFAYVDESGDSGAAGSLTYSLACVLTPVETWPNIFDRVIGFRRHLRDVFRVPVRAEIKANYLIRNGGPFRPLGLNEATRYALYRQSMRLQPKLGFRTFAILVNKQNHPDRLADDLAWEYLLQRLERFSTQDQVGVEHRVFLIHDEGQAHLVRAMARKARRAGGAGSRFGTGYMRLPFGGLLDDPVPRDSRQSYFLQLADLAAYAAYRRYYPPPVLPVPNIVPQNMWDELGGARHWQANQYSSPHGAPGIVHI
jgi:hypothetical protein